MLCQLSRPIIKHCVNNLVTYMYDFFIYWATRENTIKTLVLFSRQSTGGTERLLNYTLAVWRHRPHI